MGRPHLQPPVPGLHRDRPGGAADRLALRHLGHRDPPLDPSVEQTAGPDGTYYASQAFVAKALQDNISWAQANALPNFNPSVLVTGEHSGLKTLPQQPNNNPFLAPALAAVGVKWTAFPTPPGRPDQGVELDHVDGACGTR